MPPPEAGPAPEEEGEYEDQTGHEVQDSAEEDTEVDHCDLEDDLEHDNGDLEDDFEDDTGADYVEDDSSEVDEVDERSSAQGRDEYVEEEDVENVEGDTNGGNEDYDIDGDGVQEEGRTASSNSSAQYKPGYHDHDDVGQESEGGKRHRWLRKASRDPRVLFSAFTGHAPGEENRKVPEKGSDSGNEPEEEAQVPEKEFPIEGDLSEYDTNDTDDDPGNHDDGDDYENTDLPASEPLGVPPTKIWEFDTEPVPHK